MTLFTVAHVHNGLLNELWRPELPPKPQTDVSGIKALAPPESERSSTLEKYDPSGIWEFGGHIWGYDGQIFDSLHIKIKDSLAFIQQTL